MLINFVSCFLIFSFTLFIIFLCVLKRESGGDYFLFPFDVSLVLTYSCCFIVRQFLTKFMTNCFERLSPLLRQKLSSLFSLSLLLSFTLFFKAFSFRTKFDPKWIPLLLRVINFLVFNFFSLSAERSLIKAFFMSSHPVVTQVNVFFLQQRNLV